MGGSSAARSTGSRRHGVTRMPVAAARSLAASLCTALVCALALLPATTMAGTLPEGAAARPSAPSFELPARDGAALRLEDLRGEVVYLDFWASWCPPCLRSFPWMDALAERHAEAGLRVVAVNLDADRAAATGFLDGRDAGFDIAFDPEGRVAEAYELARHAEQLRDRSRRARRPRARGVPGEGRGRDGGGDRARARRGRTRARRGEGGSMMRFPEETAAARARRRAAAARRLRRHRRCAALRRRETLGTRRSRPRRHAARRGRHGRRGRSAPVLLQGSVERRRQRARRRLRLQLRRRR